MKSPGKEIPMRPVKSEVVSSKKFLDIPKSDIKTSKFIPPKLGSLSFGKFIVEYKHTKFKPVG